MGEVWICAIAKTEELYIREWIDCHRNIGIDHIVIADNNDSDYEHQLTPIIQDYIDEGFVEVIDKKDVLGAQLPFYNEFYTERKNEFDWVFFIDIDEFIELPGYASNIHNFIEDEKFNDFDAIILEWKRYDDNDQVYYENRPVKERFTRYRKAPENGIKYCLKSSNDIIYLTSIHYPQVKTIENEKNHLVKYCDVLGNTDILEWKNEEENKLKTSIKTNEIYYDVAYLSHYYTKSTEEYIKYKILRGRCDKKIGNYEIRYNQNHYLEFNKKSETLEESKQLFDEYLKQIETSIQEQIEKYNNQESE